MEYREIKSQVTEFMRKHREMQHTLRNHRRDAGKLIDSLEKMIDKLDEEMDKADGEKDLNRLDSQMRQVEKLLDLTSDIENALDWVVG